jgi:hypothetical protein
MKLLLTLLILISSAEGFAQQVTTVFSGRPEVKISEAGSTRVVNDIEANEGENLEVVISRIGDDYYWASRENVPMVRIDSGAFITFFAATGKGYVKVVNPGMKEAAAMMSDTERNFDYVEHMSLGLRSVTYYGKTRR